MSNAKLMGAASGAASGAVAGSVIPVVGTAFGALIGGALGYFGAKDAPETVPYTPVDIAAEQKKTMQANLGNEGDIEALLSRANSFQQGQASSLMEKAMPGWTSLSGKMTKAANDLLTNPYDVPKDVQANLARIASERGISSGARGQFSDFSLLRDLGVNSLQYGTSRINQAQGITQMLASLSPRVNPMSPMSFYVSPQQAISTQTTNNENAQGIFQAGANAKTAAGNFGSQDMWDNLMRASVMLSHTGSMTDTGQKYDPAVYDPFGQRPGNT